MSIYDYQLVRTRSIEEVVAQANNINSPRMLELKNKYSGRIWLVGNGPSLAHTPLHLLNGEYTFGMNSVSLIYPNTTWRPSFYLCISSNTISRKRHAFFQASINLNVPTFLLDEQQDRFSDRPNIYWIYSPFSRDINTEEQIQGWSANCEKIVWRYSTSMFNAAQIAVYMGFKELYLVGCDLGWKPMPDNKYDPNHFTTDYAVYTNRVSDERAERNNREMLAAHKLIARMGEKFNFKVYNATIGGELEVYPRVDMLDVLGRNQDALDS